MPCLSFPRYEVACMLRWRYMEERIAAATCTMQAIPLHWCCVQHENGDRPMATLSPNLEVPVGRVDTALTVTNTIDQERADAGEIAAAAVRSVTLAGVLVDTGATFLSLPADLIARLGLRVLWDRTISTAARPQRARLFRNAELTVLGRRATADVLELPAGTQPLFGVIPLEALGIEPDLAAWRLRLLPDGPTDTYVTA